MLSAIYLQHIRMVFVETRNGANAIRRKKFVFIEHEPQNAAQLILADDGKQSPLGISRRAHARDVLDQVGTIANEPFHAPFEIRQTIEQVRLQRLDSE